ncbi:MAG: dTDP-4-dehydrorhamnose reductase [Candidatus Velthaea sp.]
MVEPVAIAGASGQLGGALAEVYAGRRLLAPAHRELDIEDAGAVERFLGRERPAVFINCTAFHNVDVCEREPERAFAVNALAVDRLARACAAAGVQFATISTDYVFDGTLGRPYRETDGPNPRSAYGASKLAGELLTRRHGEAHYIFRTSGLYSASGTSNKGYTFIEMMLRKAENGEPLRIVDDMIFSPSYAPHVARAVRDTVDAGAFGTHHVTNAGATSWYAFAGRAFARSGLQPQLEAVRYAEFGSGVRRPMFSALENGTFAARGIGPLPAWEEGLEEYLTGRARRRQAGVR